MTVSTEPIPGETSPERATLARSLARQFRALPRSERKDWTRAAARFCRQCHESGVRLNSPPPLDPHNRWELGQVAPVPEAERRPISEQQRWQDLAILMGETLALTRRTDRFRFLRAYLQDGRRLRSCRGALDQLEETALELAARSWREAERGCLRTGAGFIAQRRKAYRIFRQANREAEAALLALLPDPDPLLRRGDACSDRGSGCTSAKVEINGRAYFLKRYDCRGIGYRLKNAVRRSRAMRVWLAAAGFGARGIPIPEPVLLIEERHGLLLGRSYILSSFHEGGERMMTLWPRLDPGSKDTLLVACAILLGRMHAMNLVHGDTNWNNILVSGPLTAPRLLLVDLDGSQTGKRVTRARALRDVQHFVRDLLRRRNRGQDRIELFLDCWERWLRPRQRRGRVAPQPLLDRYRGLA